jgi:alkanesulfonate monooxygenase SsuD/methylene tetrahydromethanopterin reductase-like flavin-dependent oxidoreductase (luciferase family)
VRLGEHRPKIFVAGLNEQMLRLAGAIADGVLLNYLPASLVPWCIERVREGGDAEVYAYVHCGVTDRDRYADLARKDLLNYAVVDAYANQFTRAGFERDVADFREKWKARERDAALAAIGDAWVDEIQIMGDAAHVRAKVAAYAQAGAKPIVFALPWGEDRRATVSDTLNALA